LKCLEKEPERRYASAEALSEDLRSFLQGAPIKAKPRRIWDRVWLWCRNPLRIRDAGVYALVVMNIWGIICIVASIYTLRGVMPTDAPLQAALSLASLGVITSGIATWVALRVLAKKVWALWVMGAIPLYYFVFQICVTAGAVTVGGFWKKDPTILLVVWLSTAPFNVFQLFLTGIALVSYYSNRRRTSEPKRAIGP